MCLCPLIFRVTTTKHKTVWLLHGPWVRVNSVQAHGLKGATLAGLTETAIATVFDLSSCLFWSSWCPWVSCALRGWEESCIAAVQQLFGVSFGAGSGVQVHSTAWLLYSAAFLASIWGWWVATVTRLSCLLCVCQSTAVCPDCKWNSVYPSLSGQASWSRSWAWRICMSILPWPVGTICTVLGIYLHVLHLWAILWGCDQHSPCMSYTCERSSGDVTSTLYLHVLHLWAILWGCDQHIVLACLTLVSDPLGMW